jgi:hypothetical protein
MEKFLQEACVIGKIKFREEYLVEDMKWSYNTLSFLNLYSAVAGGCVAVIKDPSSIMILGYDLSYLTIYNPYGEQLSQEDIRKWPEFVKIGWTINEWLVVVFQFVCLRKE